MVFLYTFPQDRENADYANSAFVQKWKVYFGFQIWVHSQSSGKFNEGMK